MTYCIHCADIISSLDWMLEQQANRVLFHRYSSWAGDAPHTLEPNPLPLLMRAINNVRLHCRVIFQPRWRATRFKAKT